MLSLEHPVYHVSHGGATKCPARRSAVERARQVRLHRQSFGRVRDESNVERTVEYVTCERVGARQSLKRALVEDVEADETQTWSTIRCSRVTR
jgi:hypothetical protein